METINGTLIVVPKVEVTNVSSFKGPPDILQLEFNSLKEGAKNMSFNYKFAGESKSDAPFEEQVIVIIQVYETRAFISRFRPLSTRKFSSTFCCPLLFLTLGKLDT